MKKIYTIFLLIIMSSSMALAQNSKIKKADKYYDQLKYTQAIDAYMRLLKKGENTVHVYQRLANSYYHINDTKQAETFYGRIMKRDNIDPETVYNYAQSLKANGKFSDYNTYMKRFAQMQPNDSRATAFMENPNYLPKIIDENNQRYAATNLDNLNSKFSDFGGRIYGNTFYFTSARNTSGKNYAWNDEPFLDIYRANIVGGTIMDAVLLEGDVNTKYHESTVAITADGKRMYFDRNDYYNGKYGKDSEGVNQLHIYYAELIEGRWTNIEPVPFNLEDYSTSHPALSPDGSYLYFTSDRPGGKGMSDIYRVSIATDGSFGTPENLGDAINTEGRDGFPFVDSNGTLYFSSDGHLGMGGLDVYAAEARGNSFAEPKNLGLGVNSSADDFAYYYDPATEEGYVSSNRADGQGSDDIYKIEKIEICELIANVNVVDANTNQTLSNVRLDLYDSRENKLKSTTTNLSGNGRFVAACDQDHIIQAHKAGYESNAESVAAAKHGEKNIRIALRPIDEIIAGDKVVLNPIHFDFDRYNITPKAAFELDKLVELMKKNQDLEIKVEAHTDNKGAAAYNQKLSERRANSTVEYLISKGIDKSRLSYEGFGQSRPIHDCGSNCTPEQDAQNRRSEFIIKQD